MSRIPPIQAEEAQKEVRSIYQVFQKKLGKIPNIFLHMGHSKAVLQAYNSLADAANQTVLSPALREQIALVVSQANECQYCLSAHSAIGKGAGLSDQEIMEARHGQAKEAKTQAILKFAKLLSDNKGHVSDQDVQQLKKAGVSDQEMIEVILIVVQTIFTNYFNHVTDPQIDFPQAPHLK